MSLEEGFKIAKRVLREQYSPNGILAGASHFRDVWARDSFFASLGALTLRDYDIVKKNLESFLHSQVKGQVPLRIGRTNLTLLFDFMNIHFAQKPRPIFHQDKGNNPATDPNSLMIIVFEEYYKATHNQQFLNRYLHKLEEAVQWFHPINSLIKESVYAGWADSIKKQGYVLYSNVCYVHALFSMSELFKATGEIKKSEDYIKKFEEAKEILNKKFWNGSYYNDWIDETTHEFFSTDGNLLAIIWDLAPEPESIERKIEEFNINKSVPSLTNHPKYPKKYVSPFMRFFGFYDYHNGLSWAWLGALDAIAKSKLGMKKEALDVLEKLSETFIKYGNVYEVYNPEPIKRLFYKSERNFAWSAGMFVLAYKTVKLIS